MNPQDGVDYLLRALSHLFTTSAHRLLLRADWRRRLERRLVNAGGRPRARGLCLFTGIHSGRRHEARICRPPTSALIRIPQPAQRCVDLDQGDGVHGAREAGRLVRPEGDTGLRRGRRRVRRRPMTKGSSRGGRGAHGRSGEAPCGWASSAARGRRRAGLARDVEEPASGLRAAVSRSADGVTGVRRSRSG